MIAPDQILRLPLLPILAAQGLWVRAKADTLPEPPGPREGTLGHGPALRLLVLGDSSAAGVGAEMQSQAMPACLAKRLSSVFTVTYQVHARTGDTTRTALSHLQDQPTVPFDIALVVLGVNDVTRATSAKRYIGRMRQIEQTLVARGIRHVVFSGVPPMGHFPLLPHPLRWVLGQHAARLDQALAEFSRAAPNRSHCALTLPLTANMAASDGFHPSIAAHRLWAAILAQHIQPIAAELT